MKGNILEIMHQLTLKSLQFLARFEYSPEDLKEAAEFEIQYRDGLYKSMLQGQAS